MKARLFVLFIFLLSSLSTEAKQDLLSELNDLVNYTIKIREDLKPCLSAIKKDTSTTTASRLSFTKELLDNLKSISIRSNKGYKKHNKLAKEFDKYLTDYSPDFEEIISDYYEMSDHLSGAMEDIDGAVRFPEDDFIPRMENLADKLEMSILILDSYEEKVIKFKEVAFSQKV